MMKPIKLFYFLILLLTTTTVYAGRIEKAFEALQMHDYFKAKNLFEKSLKADPVPANYGLSIIYSRNNNPFYNIDSALVSVQRSLAGFPELKEKEKRNLAEISIDLPTIQKQEQLVGDLFYKVARDEDSLESLQHFIDAHDYSQRLPEAIVRRDELAFEIAEENNTYQAYYDFFKTYPESLLAQEAKDNYEQMLYTSKTRGGDLMSYVNFVNVYPESPFHKEAESRVFELSTQNGKLDDYVTFIKTFPKNHNLPKAWERIYKLWFTDFDDAEIEAFVQQFPDFPYLNILREDKKNRDRYFYQISKNDLYGFVDDQGDVIVEPQYDYVHEFSNELAMVAGESKVGYITKKGKLELPFTWDDGEDFIMGYALVYMGDYMGMINRLGNYVFEPVYDELWRPKKGIVLAEKEESFNYYNLDGELLFGPYAYAEEFRDSLAIVGTDSTRYLITIQGEKVAGSEREDLKWFSDSLLIYTLNGRHGLISLEGKILDQPEFDFIGTPENGYALMEKKGKYGYLDSLGQVAIPAKYTTYSSYKRLAQFDGGFALTSYRGKKGLIDSLGKKVYPNIFEDIKPGTEFPMACKKRGKWGFVDKRVQLAIKYQYDMVSAMENGRAIVSKGNKWGVIDADGKVLVKLEYDKLEALTGNHLVATMGIHKGIIDYSGKVVLDYYYSRISRYLQNVIRLDVRGEIYYFNIETREFIYGQGPQQ